MLTASSSSFASTPSGYFLSLAVLLAIPTLGYTFKRFMDRLTSQDSNMRLIQIEQTKQSEALTMILKTTNPPGHDSLATTIALIKADIAEHIRQADAERHQISEQIGDLRQTQFDRPARRTP